MAIGDLTRGICNQSAVPVRTLAKAGRVPDRVAKHDFSPHFSNFVSLQLRTSRLGRKQGITIPTVHSLQLLTAAKVVAPLAKQADFKYVQQTKFPNALKFDWKQNPAPGLPETQLLPNRNPSIIIEVVEEVLELTTIPELVHSIKEQLRCVKNSWGEISVSAYDTAWVARIPNAAGSPGPQFPRTLDWIVENQHTDGSWGDSQRLWLYDRFAQTLACIVTLKIWGHCPSCVQRGEEFINKYANMLEAEEILRMPIGFELFFPQLLEEAKVLGLNLPYDTSFFGKLSQIRQKKLQRIPLELLHSMPTTMLHTLEGLQSLDLDWARLLKFRSEDGSIGCSPSSSAALYMKTGDKKCLSFLEKTVQKFNSAVPTVYPLDTFHNIFLVDMLERLGISHYFEAEIEEILASAYRHWSDEQGICWASVLLDVPDLDDTSIAFRILRQHGYNVSSEAFKVFQKEDKFVCFPIGQMVQGISDMFNLYRASMAAYPGEETLDAAQLFSRGFLVDSLANNKGDADKWALKKDLAGEIEYAFKHPYHERLHRMGIRHYLDKYSPDDAWIGKTIYRLPLVNNVDYLKLAKAEFNWCTIVHYKELHQILRWITDVDLPDSWKIREETMMLYAMFSAEVWEPNLSTVRIATAKCVFIAMTINRLFQAASLKNLRQLVEAVERWDPTGVQNLPENFRSAFMLIYDTVNETTNDSDKDGHILEQLVHLWHKALSSFLDKAMRRAEKGAGATDEVQSGSVSGLEAIVLGSILMSGEMKDPQCVTWMEKDSTFMRIASEAVGLAHGIALKRLTIGEGEDSQTFAMMKQQMIKELNFQMGQLSTVPSIVKRILWSMVKVANFYHSDSPQESLSELQRLMLSRAE